MKRIILALLAAALLVGIGYAQVQVTRKKKQTQTEQTQSSETKRKQQEAEAKRKREAEAKRQREAEAQRQREAEAKRQREAEAQRQRESEERRRREEEAKKARETGYINGHEYVDLGLPSGLKWATCNVGASSPVEYGNYYAWGEITPKSQYTGYNSQTDSKSKNELLSAGIVNAAGNLTMSYDAARANWGGTWRMPTKSEQEELINCCTWRWSINKGQLGFMVTGSNGRSIFLPAAGYFFESSRYYAGIGGEYGFYWSSSLYDDDSHAYELYHNKSSRWKRYNGFPVRPVSD